jgi:hypothetical protein
LWHILASPAHNAPGAYHAFGDALVAETPTRREATALPIGVDQQEVVPHPMAHLCHTDHQEE